MPIYSGAVLIFTSTVRAPGKLYGSLFHWQLGTPRNIVLVVLFGSSMGWQTAVPPREIVTSCSQASVVVLSKLNYGTVSGNLIGFR